MVNTFLNYYIFRGVIVPSRTRNGQCNGYVECPAFEGAKWTVNLRAGGWGILQ